MSRRGWPKGSVASLGLPRCGSRFPQGAGSTPHAPTSRSGWRCCDDLGQLHGDSRAGGGRRPTPRAPVVTLELNDSVLWAAHEYPADELYRRVVNTLEFFDQEGTDQPRVLTLALHPHLAGVPHRLPFLAKLLDRLQAREDTAFLRAGAVHDWYQSQVTAGAPAGG
jgi:hypothetical protein